MQLYWLFTLVALVGYRSFAVSAQEESTTPEYDDDDSGSAGDGERHRIPTTTEVESTTRDLLEDIQPFVKDIQRKVYPAFSELLADDNVSNECTTSLLATLRGVMTQKKWALMSEYSRERLLRCIKSCISNIKMPARCSFSPALRLPKYSRDLKVVIDALEFAPLPSILPFLHRDDREHGLIAFR